MKRCPQCLEAYDGEENFCELDGQELLVDPTFHAVEPTNLPTSRVQNSSERSLMVILGVAGGVLISAALFLVYSVTLNGSAEPSQLATQVLPATPVFRSAPPSSSQQPEPRPTATPLENELSEPDPEANTEDAEKEAPVPAKVNHGPISTSARTEEPNVRTVIQLHDGSTIDVDAAWKEGQGIWYRRGGLVSFLDSKDVKSISTVADAKKADASAEANSR